MAAVTRKFVLGRTEPGMVQNVGGRHVYVVYVPADRENPSSVEYKITRGQFDELGQPGAIWVTVSTEEPTKRTPATPPEDSSTYKKFYDPEGDDTEGGEW